MSTEADVGAGDPSPSFDVDAVREAIERMNFAVQLARIALDGPDPETALRYMRDARVLAAPALVAAGVYPRSYLAPTEDPVAA